MAGRLPRLPHFIRRLPAWPFLTLAGLVAAGFLLAWVQALASSGLEFTFAVADEPPGRLDVVFDAREQRVYQIAYGQPPTLKGSIIPAAPVQIRVEGEVEGSEYQVGADGTFSHSLPGLSPGTYHYLADGPWGSRRDLWLVYRPEEPLPESGVQFTRSLSVTITSGAADLLYRLTLPAESVSAIPAVAELGRGAVGGAAFLKWTFYPGVEARFDGFEFTELGRPAYTREGGDLAISIPAMAHPQAEVLNRLLAVAPGPSPVTIELESRGVGLLGASPWPPDEAAGSRWVWRGAPVEITMEGASAPLATGSPGSQGLALIRQQVEGVGEVLAALLLFFLPLTPFAWWALLIRKGVVQRGAGLAAVGALAWLAPVLYFLIFNSDLEAGSLAMMASSLAMTVLLLRPPASRRAWVFGAAGALLVTFLIGLWGQALPYRPWALAVLASLTLVGLARLGAGALWPDRRFPRSVWLAAFASSLFLAYPVPIPAFGYYEGVGWSLFVWASFYTIVGLYLLPFVILAASLGVLRDQSAELAAQPTRLVALGRLLFVFYLVGATRGLTPTALELEAAPTVVPVAFFLAFLAYRWLVPGGESRLRALARGRDKVCPAQAELIQKALDVEWARSARNKLLQEEGADPATYENKKAQLEKYLEERQRVTVVDWGAEPEAGTGSGGRPAAPAPLELQPEQALFAFGPSAEAWANGLLGGGRALFAGAWVLLIYLPFIWERTGSLANPFLFLFALAAEVLPLVVRWALLGFFLGYFFPFIRGSNGWQKGLYIALAVAACTVPHDVLNGAGLSQLPAIGLDLAQNALLLTFIGLWAFDYEILRRHGHGVRRLLIVHNFSFLTGYGTSLVAALGTTLVGLFTGRLEPVLRALLDLLVPGGQPSG